MAVSPDYLALGPSLVLAATALALLAFDMIDPDSSNRKALAGLATVGTTVAAAVAAVLLGVGVGTTESVALFDGMVRNPPTE